MPLTTDQRKEYDAAAQQKRTARVGDVAVLYAEEFAHGPTDPQRRMAGKASLAVFCKTYGGATFNLPWSPSHLAAITRIEAAVRNGDQLALAMPRGSGKSALCRWACIWAVVNGLSPYVVLIGATDAAARKALRAIRNIFRFNDLLMEDYPEICGPCRHLNGEPRKASSQHFRGTPTGIQWGTDQIILAHMPLDFAEGSEAVIDVAGITGDIRGRFHVRRDGATVRPTVAICDDPQTRQSARSQADTDARLETISGDVKYLAGPEAPVGVVVPCTVLRGGDLADRLLDREANPEWHGIRTRFFESMPSDDAIGHWEGEYSRLRRKALREDREPTEANAYYIAHKDAMDDGANPSWPERFYAKKGEVSAVQHGMNAYLRDRKAFLAEYQNDPEEALDLPTVPMLDERAFAAKVSGLPMGTAIDKAAFAVAMIDVHETLLYWSVAGVRSDFSGGPMGAGVYPKQPTRDFTLRSAKVTLQDKHPGGAENAIVEGLLALFGELVRHPWKTADDSLIPLSLILVDTGYKPAEVARAILSAPAELRPLLRGSRGMGFGPDAKPMTEYDTSPSMMRRHGPDFRAPRWYVPADTRHGIEVVCFDTDFWKATLHARFCTPPGVPGEWSLWGDRDEDHRDYIRHLLSQRPREKAGRTGRTVNVFELQSGGEDHWLDTAVGCLVAGSVLGCRLAGQGEAQKPKVRERKRVSYIGG